MYLMRTSSSGVSLAKFIGTAFSNARRPVLRFRSGFRGGLANPGNRDSPLCRVSRVFHVLPVCRGIPELRVSREVLRFRL